MERRRATDVTSPGFDAYVVDRSSERCAIERYGCRCEVHRVGLGYEEMRKHVCLVLAAKGAGEMHGE